VQLSFLDQLGLALVEHLMLLQYLALFNQEHLFSKFNSSNEPLFHNLLNLNYLQIHERVLGLTFPSLDYLCQSMDLLEYLLLLGDDQDLFKKFCLKTFWLPMKHDLDIKVL